MTSWTFDALVDEALTQIPRYAPGWTDYNAHDPGITLVELLAWLVEMDLYRLDRTSDASVRAFLRLLGIVPSPPRVAHAVVGVTVGGSQPVMLPAGVQVGSSVQTSVVFQTEAPVFVSPARVALFLAPPAVDALLYIGFDQRLATQPATISLYLESPDPEADWLTRERLAHPSCHYGARTVWEYQAASGAWQPLADVVDETRALSLSGFVRFSTPADHQAGGPNGDSVDYFIRCRLASGGYDCPPTIARVLTNAVPARHVIDRDLVPRDPCTGAANQVFALEHPPVAPGSTRVRLVLGGAQDASWEERLDWDAVGPHDHVYVLDLERGELRFGNGRMGWVPTSGSTLHVTYQSGGGPTGNVPPGTLDSLADTPRNAALVPGWPAARVQLGVTQPRGASGGRSAETLDQARGRAIAALAERRRAVAAEDYEALALATPGVPVARARALPGYHPDYPCMTAEGCLTLVVVPACPVTHPRPTAALLAAVRRWLEPRRTLTTELHVIGPSLSNVCVTAELYPARAADPREVLAAAQQALAGFLNPLHGGPEGAGWPIGRAVYRSEVLAVLQAVVGVDHVLNLTIDVDALDGARCGNAVICPHGLVVSGAHRLTLGTRSTPA